MLKLFESVPNTLEPRSKMVNDPDAYLDVMEDIMATEIHTGGGCISGDDKIDVDKFESPTWYQIFLSILRMICVKLCALGMGCRQQPSMEGFSDCSLRPVCKL